MGRRRIAGVALVVALVAAGCGSGDDGPAADTAPAGNETATTASPATTPTTVPDLGQTPVPIQELVIDGADYEFNIEPDGGAGLQPGWTLIHFDNVGDEAHQIMFAVLKDGVDMAELAEAGAGDASGASAIEFVDMLGGVSYIDPDNETSALVELPEGIVLGMCYVPTAEGVAHADLGMSVVLPVAASDDADKALLTGESAQPQDIVGTIEFGPDGYVLPERLGTGWYHVVNTDTGEPGKGLHELAVMRLGEKVDDVDTLVEELAANIIPEVEIEATGGLGAMSAGFEGYVHLDLEPGEYLAVDFMPDPGVPRPHMLDGYHATFTVDG